VWKEDLGKVFKGGLQLEAVVDAVSNGLLVESILKQLQNVLETTVLSHKHHG